MTAREEILSLIRAALPGEPASVAVSYASIPRDYQKQGTLTHSETMDLFIDRLLDYDAQVIQLGDESELAHAIAQAMNDAGEDRLLLSPLLPEHWRPADAELIIDNQLATEAIDRAQAVVTTCEVAIASTGTIILVHAGAQCRRIATLLPDHHICIVKRSQICEIVPEALRKLDSTSDTPITTISGPSATSDIEMTRIRGVHGPRRLTVMLYG